MKLTQREQFLIEIAKFVGVPYIWGGESAKSGLDCSGLVQLLLAKLHLDPPNDQTADGLMKIFSSGKGEFIGTTIDAKDAQLGDLVFYGASKSRATHIAMALGDGQMVEAGGGGSKCTTVEIARKLGAQVRISTINRRTDLICVIRPQGLPW